MAMHIAVGNFPQTNISVDQYRIAKIQMIEREFMMPMKPEEKKHMAELKSEAEIDRYARTILKKLWE